MHIYNVEMLLNFLSYLNIYLEPSEGFNFNHKAARKVLQVRHYLALNR